MTTTEGGGETYQARQGDTLIGIAHSKGWRSWEPIWQHDRNAALREKRSDPQVLAEGDEVFIPEKTPAEYVVATRKRHSFSARVLKAKFRVELHDEGGRKLAGKRFELTLKGAETHEGTTGEGAIVELDIDPRPTTGTLKVYLGGADGKTVEWHLNLGNLDPVETTSGVQARLTNLGFKCGEIDGVEDEELKSALQRFQIVHALEVSGETDQATRDKLVELHDKS